MWVLKAAGKVTYDVFEHALRHTRLLYVVKEIGSIYQFGHNEYIMSILVIVHKIDDVFVVAADLEDLNLIEVKV